MVIGVIVVSLVWYGLCGVVGMVWHILVRVVWCGWCVCLFSVLGRSFSLGSSTAETRVPVLSSEYLQYWLAVMVHTCSDCIWKAGRDKGKQKLKVTLSYKGSSQPGLQNILSSEILYYSFHPGKRAHRV